jgi:hypothetical protein
MTSTVDVSSPFERPRRTWPRALRRALVVELILLGLLIPGFLHSGGADNPIWFFLALILQFPSSLVFISPAAWDHFARLIALVALLEFCLFALLFRRPWAPQ